MLNVNNDKTYKSNIVKCICFHVIERIVYTCKDNKKCLEMQFFIAFRPKKVIKTYWRRELK